MVKHIHLNWGACGDWHDVRARLKFLPCTLYANFADLDGEPARIKGAIERAGFVVESDETHPFYHYCLRLSDIPQPVKGIKL